MNDVDELLSSLRSIPRPDLSPFFAARVASECVSDAAASKAAQARRTPKVLRLYWIVLTFFAGIVLLQSWAGVAMIVAALAIAALTPAGVLTPTASRPEPRR